MTMTIAKNVKTICSQQGITLTELANKLNVTPGAVQKYIHNQNIQLSTIVKIATALNVNIVDILNTNNYINPNQTNTNNIMLTCPNCHKIIHIEIKPSTSAKADK